jgi:hypothetical protein
MIIKIKRERILPFFILIDEVLLKRSCEISFEPIFKEYDN